MTVKATTPEAFAREMGWGAKRVRRLARKLGACRVLGNRMALLDEDIATIKAAVGTEALKKAEFNKHFARPSFVYFVLSGEYIKIGWSENWRLRLANMQTSNPDLIKVLLVLAQPKALESELHQKFAAHAHRGEWFRDHADIRTFIRQRREECRYRAARKK